MAAAADPFTYGSAERWAVITSGSGSYCRYGERTDEGWRFGPGARVVGARRGAGRRVLLSQRTITGEKPQLRNTYELAAE